MGISKLIPFLKEKNLLKPFEGWPDNSKVAIDVPIFAHKFIYAEKTFEGLERKLIEFEFLDDNEKSLMPFKCFDAEGLLVKILTKQRPFFVAACAQSTLSWNGKEYKIINANDRDRVEDENIIDPDNIDGFSELWNILPMRFDFQNDSNDLPSMESQKNRMETCMCSLHDMVEPCEICNY